MANENEVVPLSNQQIGEILQTYPEKVGSSLEDWKKAQAETKRLHGEIYLKLKAVNTGKDMKENHLKNLVAADPKYYAAQMVEIEKEAIYTKAYETLMSAKKLAAIRTAF